MRRGTPEFFERIEPRRIAVIKPSALGDVVQALPLLSVLRARFPRTRLTWIIQKELRDLVTGHPCLDDVLCIERRPTFSAAYSLLRQIRAQRFDMVFDLQGLLRSAVLTQASGARWRVGLETAREGSAWSTNVQIPETSREMPAHARYWRVAQALGYGDARREAWVNVPAVDVAWARQRLVPLRGPVFAVQWGAKWETKRWPIAGFAEVLSRAVQTWGGSVVIVGGRAEQSDCAQLADRLEQVRPGCVLNLAGQTTIKQLAALLSQVDAVVSNDSGPLHLAAELGRPTLGIFTCTSAIRSGPPGDQHEFVSTELPCAASYKKVCPHQGAQHLACHSELSSEKVWRGLVRLVDRHQLAGMIRRAA